MKKNIFLIDVFGQQRLSKQDCKRHFFSGSIKDMYKVTKRVLLVYMGVSFILALQVTAFSDVHQQDWFAPYVQKFQTMGVIEGDGVTGNFSPEREANRAEIAKMFSKYDEVLNADFLRQLKQMKKEILAEMLRDIEVKTYSFRNQLQRKIESESSNRDAAVSQLVSHTQLINESLVLLDDRVDVVSSVAVDPIVLAQSSLPLKTVSAAVTASPVIVQQPASSFALPAKNSGAMVLIKQGVPKKCASGWTQSGFETKWVNGYLFYERTCAPIKACSVAYYQGAIDAVASCEGAMQQVDYLRLGVNDAGSTIYRRVCGVCK